MMRHRLNQLVVRIVHIVFFSNTKGPSGNPASRVFSSRGEAALRIFEIVNWAPKAASNGQIEMSQHGKQFVIKTRHRNEILKRRILLVSTGARWKFGHELSNWFFEWILVHQSSRFLTFSADVTTGKSLCHSQIKSDENSENRIVPYLYWSTLVIVARSP